MDNDRPGPLTRLVSALLAEDTGPGFDPVAFARRAVADASALRPATDSDFQAALAATNSERTPSDAGRGRRALSRKG